MINLAIEISKDRAICFRCGRAYAKWQGSFPVSYSSSHKGVGHLPICRDCMEKLYEIYLAQYGDTKTATFHMCRKLDIYWNENIYDLAFKRSTSRSLMSQYISKVNSITFAGKCFDDSVLESEQLKHIFDNTGKIIDPNPEIPKEEEEPTPKEIVDFWGQGYSNDMYAQLEQRRSYYMSKFPPEDLDVGAEALIRQICNLEVAIARDSAAGKSIDKSVNSLNTLLGSLNLKPAQRKDNDLDSEMLSTPLGVWIHKYENQRPLPEVENDENHIKKYIFTWMGHLCKMLGIKNGYTKMYEDEIEKLRVEKPEYDGDDEDLMIDYFSEFDNEAKQGD